MAKKSGLGLNLFLNLLNTALNLLFPVFTFPYAARVLGPSGLGSVGMLTNLYGYFAMLTSAITLYGTREIAKAAGDPLTLEAKVNRILSFNLAANLVLAVAWLVSCALVPKLSGTFLLSALFVVPIFVTPFSVEWYFNGGERFSFLVLRNLVCKAVAALLLFALVKSPSDILGYLIVTIGTIVFPAFPGFFSLVSEVKVRLRFDWPRDMLESIWRILATSGIGSTYQLTDSVLLGFLAGDLAVGWYLAARKLIAVATGVCAAMSYVLMPRLSSLIGHSEDAFDSTFLLGVSLFWFATIPITVFFLSSAGGVISVAAGPKFIESTTTLRILALSLPSTAVATFLGFQFFMVKGREIAIVKANLLGASLNLALNLLLIPRLSHNGPAVALVASETAVAGSLILQARGSLRFSKIFGTSGRYVAASSAAAFVAWACGHRFEGNVQFFMQAASFSLVYLLFLLVLKDPLVSMVERKAKEAVLARVR